MNDRQALLREAWALQGARRPAEAEAVYRRVLARWPDIPDAWYNLGLVQRQQGRFDDALASYRQALERGVSQPEEVHLNRGVIYWDFLHDAVAAERELEAALAHNPRYAPALLNFANLREDFGRRDDALTLYERLLDIAPGHHEALARYATLKGATGTGDPLVLRLRRAIDDPATTAADRASLGFALGKVLDGCGAYDEAFDAYARANAASRASAGPRGVYDRRAHEAFVDRLIAAFPPGAPRPRASHNVAPPIFICGMFRSGSTLIEQVLGAHSRVTPAGELPYLPALVRGPLAPFPESLGRVTQRQLDDFAAQYRTLLARRHPGAGVVTDKRPDNFLYIGLIKALFPDARIIHTVRNPLDNCLSIHFLHLDPAMSYALDLMDTAHWYREYRRLMAHWQALYGEDILEVNYDALVSGPRPVIERTLAFCGLEWEDACLDFHRGGNAVRTASAWQVRQPLYRQSSGRWQNYAAHLDRLREYLSDLVGEGGAVTHI